MKLAFFPILKKSLVIPFVLLLSNLTAQKLKEIKDTVHISNGYVSILAFSDEIIDGNFGSSAILTNPDGSPVKVDYTEEGYSSLKMIARKKFKKTNLIVILKGGIIYDFLVIYNQEPPKYFYQFGDFTVRKKEQPLEVESQSDEDLFWMASADGVIDQEIKEVNQIKKSYDTIPYQRTARVLYSAIGYKKYKNNFTSQKDVFLGLNHSWIKGDYMYFKFYIENHSKRIFDISNWHFKSAPYKSYNKTSVSGQIISPVYEFKKSVTEVLPGRTAYKIFVFKKFSITDEDFFYVRVGNDQAQKYDLELAVKEKRVNNPTWIGDNKIRVKKTSNKKEESLK